MTTSRIVQRLPLRSGFFRTQAGYSLYDLIVTSAVAGTLSIGTAGMVGLVQNSRITSEANELMAHLSLARSEAIKRGSAITLCAKATGAECLGSRDWRNGWIIFMDMNGNGSLEPGESILRVQDTPTINYLQFGAWGPGTGRWVTYKADGTTKQNGTFTFCDNRGTAKAKAVILLGTGRPRVSTLSASNEPLSCS